MTNFSYRIILLIFLFTAVSVKSQKAVIDSVSLFSEDLGTEKTVWIIHPGATLESGKRLPVIYLQDAQNLFDASRSYAGEWQVDEALEAMNFPFIVVGVEHGNEKRMEELTPFVHEKYGGGKAEAYATFIVEQVKPYIDDHYPTLSDAEHTVVGGSSLGGLFAHYAMLTHPDIFRSALVFSPSYWYSEEIFELTRSNFPKGDTRWYLATGGEEPESMVPDLERMAQLLQESGVGADALFSAIRPGEGHNEGFWSREFVKALEWFALRMK